MMWCGRESPFADGSNLLDGSNSIDGSKSQTAEAATRPGPLCSRSRGATMRLSGPALLPNPEPLARPPRPFATFCLALLLRVHREKGVLGAAVGLFGAAGQRGGR